MTVHVPDGAKPGIYKGELALTATGRAVASLPVELRVADVALAAPAKRAGCYYRSEDKTDDQIRLELRDICEHGGTLLVWRPAVRYVTGASGEIEYDTSEIRRAVSLEHECGILPPYIVGPNPEEAARLAGLTVAMTPEFAKQILASEKFRAIYSGALRAIEALEKEMNAGEFVYLWMDEIMDRGRLEPWMAFAGVTRQLSRKRIYITIHNRDQAKVDAVAPYVDIRCYHGHTLDAWLTAGHTWEELKKELAADGDEAWTYYNIRDYTVTSEFARLCNGYWLWRSPLMAHTPWIYNSYGGSPFDDMDSDKHDFAYAAPHPGKLEMASCEASMVSTLEWECFREGYDDLRYLATLEEALKKAGQRRADDPRIRTARALLDSYWNFTPTVPEQAAKLTAADYERRRADMAAAIESLRAVAAKGE